MRGIISRFYKNKHQDSRWRQFYHAKARLREIGVPSRRSTIIQGQENDKSADPCPLKTTFDSVVFTV